MAEEGEEFEGSEVFDFDELAQLFIEAVDNDDEDLLKTTFATAIDNNVSLQDLFDCEDMAGCTAMEIVRTPSMLQLLLEYGIAVDQCNEENKSTALFHMGDAGLDDMLAVLIEHGADVSIRNKYGYTPLHQQILQSSLPCLVLLLNCGADLYARLEDGSKPIEIAQERNQFAAAEVFRQRDDTETSSFS